MAGHIMQPGDIFSPMTLDRIGEAELRESEDGSVQVWTLHETISAEEVEQAKRERRAQAAYDAVMAGEGE
jgi:hypothetical protein